MRKLGQRAPEEETEIDITPMLDVVFIMLIFFIVTATFVKEAGVDVFKPEAQTSESKKTANILIAIDAKDGIWIDGAQVDSTAVTVNVKRLRSENPKGTVMIQADKDSSHKTLLEVYKGVKDTEATAGPVPIAISTEPT